MSFLTLMIKVQTDYLQKMFWRFQLTLIWYSICFSLLLKVELYKNIRPLFANKPIIVVSNKVDVVRPDELSEEKKVQYTLLNFTF